MNEVTCNIMVGADANAKKATQAGTTIIKTGFLFLNPGRIKIPFLAKVIEN
jgi:hypothetical protein